MNLDKDKYIIVEIIPDNSNPDIGKICQLQALKIDKLKLIDRFDYRLEKNKIDNIAIIKAISYDSNQFNYVDDSTIILDDFIRWIEDYPLILIECDYTLNYFKNIKNKKELVYPYLGMQHSYDVFEKIIDKYKLEPSNHLVDLIYEAIIFEKK